MQKTITRKRTKSQNYKSLTIHLSRIRETTGILANQPEAVLKYFKDVADLAQEAFWTLTLDTKLQIIKRHLVTLGVLDASLFHPREIMRPAIQDAARGIVMVHNHPSGNVEPSVEDLEITHRLYYISRLMQIELMDHIIIAKRGRKKMRYYSLREQGHFSTFNNTAPTEKIFEL